ncbi:choline/ethanolamine kinase family protein [Thioclava sp. GXIMD2076]|uniref:choline/ethanolamine kinase family protein n=1 Tax=Thioclava sp. GXIMD2076 TaxID=3131931 RepID=UPI0030D22F6B
MIDITQALAKVPHFEGRDLTPFRINGGITNINWRVRDDTSGEMFFVKQHGPGTSAYIDRHTALSAAKIAAAKGVGPQVIYHDDDEGLEVHEFLQGFRSCSVLDAQDAEIRAKIMTAYKDIHDDLMLEKANTGLEQFESFARTVTRESTNDSPLLPRDLEQMLWQARRAGAAIKASGIDLVGCLNDAYISNYMRNEAGEIRLIDLEYAAANDPYWDVAMFSFEIFFDDLHGISSILEMYEGKVRPEALARTYLYIGIAITRWGLWAVHQSLNSPIAFDFAKYSRTLLMRARRQMLSPDWEWALAHV